jgi:hypothetical protein
MLRPHHLRLYSVTGGIYIQSDMTLYLLAISYQRFEKKENPASVFRAVRKE